jgi:hypothetical protein
MRRVGHRIDRRCDAFRQRVLLQRLALALVELPRRSFQRARQPIELAGVRVAEAAIEQRGRDPQRREERQRRGRQEGEDQTIAQSVHRRGPFAIVRA